MSLDQMHTLAAGENAATTDHWTAHEPPRVVVRQGPGLSRASWLDLSKIAEPVATRYKVTLTDILGPRRHGPIVRARQAFMFEAWRAGFTKADIARFLRVTHAAVIHGIRVHEEREMK